MKKIISVIMAAAMLLAMAGCGAKRPKKVEVVVPLDTINFSYRSTDLFTEHLNDLYEMKDGEVTVNDDGSVTVAMDADRHAEFMKRFDEWGDELVTACENEIIYNFEHNADFTKFNAVLDFEGLDIDDEETDQLIVLCMDMFAMTLDNLSMLRSALNGTPDKTAEVVFNYIDGTEIAKYTASDFAQLYDYYEGLLY